MGNKSRYKNPAVFTHGVYVYLDGEQVVYIGIDKHIDEDRRHGEHLKPSKRLKIKHEGKVIDNAEELVKLAETVPFTKDNTEQAGQLINNIIQDQGLEYQVIFTCFDADVMYEAETFLINKHQPKYNVKFDGWKEKYGQTYDNETD